MRVEYINPFVESAFNVLKEVLNSEIKRGELYLKSTSQPVLGVATIIGLAGDVEGRVLLDMSMDTALNIASEMNMEKLETFDELGKATITELANMITGQAITKLHELGFKFDLTPPSMLTGNDMVISDSGVEALIVPIELTLRKTGNKCCNKRKELEEYVMRAKMDYPNINTKNPDGKRPDGSSYKVLIVDDSMFVAKQISQILSSEGFDIVGTAKDGIEGLEKYKELHPNVDLVTMDITMPNMDGVTCLQKIIEFDPDAKIVMISALGKQDLVKQSLLSGAKNYIVKPLDRAKVLERNIFCSERINKKSVYIRNINL